MSKSELSWRMPYFKVFWCDELRQMLEARGLDTKGKKRGLIAREFMSLPAELRNTI